ncbi:MAG: hypothetical protein JO133_08435 [Burkholderiaceae bacterium]|nr:hypothetical protein [Burkholderiaceae bacterium]
MSNRSSRGLIFLTLFAGARAALAADDACAGFKWDVTRERVLFATAAEAVTAGTDVASAPLLIPDRLYELATPPQQEVKFQVAPGKTTPIEGASAGLARLRLSTTGEYRISLDQSSWIDVVADNHLVAAEDFQGRRGCHTPHKIVLYWLPSGEDLILQLSGAVAPHVRLTIVPMPAALSR